MSRSAFRIARILTLLRRRAIEIVNSDLVSASADRRDGGSKRKWKGPAAQATGT